YGYAKQGAGYGYSGVKGLNALIAIASTPLSAPVICATRLRKGNTNSARGAARLVADALVAAKAAGAGGPHGTGLIILRADSAFYNHDVIAAARRAKVRFSVTVRMSPAITTAISGIGSDDWTPISYPDAVWDNDEQRLVSDAEIAEIPYTAFTSRRKADHIAGRLIVRRVKRLNPASPKPRAGKAKDAVSTAGQQQELFSLYRYHAVFSDSPLVLVQAEKAHRGHAIIEQVNADLKQGPLAHLPSVILSRLVDHGCDLGVCVVDGVVDVSWAGRWSARSDELRALVVGRVATTSGAQDRRCALFAEGLGQRVA
ncbi:MAG: hypothetical protein M3510_04605, partial [Actinomycetota bacterium]|nr:hypothetical protein [Actinomycetota bacterium]